MDSMESETFDSNSLSPLPPPNATDSKNCVYNFSDNADSDTDDLTYKTKLNTHTKNSPAVTHEESSISKESQDYAGTSDQAKTTTDDDEQDEDEQDDSVVTEEEQSKRRPESKPEATIVAAAHIVQPVRVKRIQNGKVPISGKPMAYAIDKKSNKIRGRPKRKALVTMYQSQLSDNQIGIKLKLKKSLFEMTPSAASSTAAAVAAGSDNSKKSSKSSSKKRSKKSRRQSDSEEEDSDYKKRRRKERVNNNTVKSKKDDDPDDQVEQSPWAYRMPDEILYKIFETVVQQEGCLPSVVRLNQVCSQWRNVALSPKLWNNLDLATWTKERFRTELMLKWLIQNRCSACEEVNFANYKVTDIRCVLEKLLENCPNLIGITLSGWKGFQSEHLTFLVNKFKSLQRLDLSSINMDLHPNKSSVDLQSFCGSMKAMGERLTHLYLAHNRLVGVPQIIIALTSYCPNLVLLDLSNVTTAAVSHAVMHIEKLQQGCQKLKVLRITNSNISLSAISLQEQMDSPGFPELEELSIASLSTVSRLMSDESLQRILKTSTKLHLLDVRGCARLTHDSLIRLPTWDLKHLFLSGCSITRDVGSGLELIASKWAHSLIECDLAWANVQTPLDNAIRALAEKGQESPLTHLNLCGSSVSLEAVKEILTNCTHLNSINLSSCRGLPRGVKRLIQGTNEIEELRENLGVKLKYPIRKPENDDPKVSPLQP